MDLTNRAALRRLAVVIAGAALVVAIGGFAVAVRSHPQQVFADDAVPWADLPATRPDALPPMRPLPRPQAAPCTADALETLWPDGGATISDAANGSDSTGFTLQVRNIGATTCTLSGVPRVQGIDRDGKPVGTPAEEGHYQPSLSLIPGPATIEPGEPAEVYVSMASNGCHGPVREYTGANVALDNGFRFTIRNAWLVGRCPLKVTPWAPLSNQDRRFWPLEAHLMTPPFAKVGTDYWYVLELINVTNARVPLLPCPIFTQALSVDDRFEFDKVDQMVHYTNRLNCEPQSTVGPHGVVRFKMKIHIPDGYPTGKTQLYWIADESRDPFASSTLILS